jgi:hypothetical protein
MDGAQPRGMQEQVSAITDLISPQEEEIREEDSAPEGVDEVEPEQAASGESLEADAVEDGSEATEESADGQEAGEIRTVVDFAKAAGWSPEELYALPVRLDNGEEIPLGQMKDALQTAARERAELNAARESVAQHYQHLKQVEAQMLQGSQQMTQEVQDAQSRVMAVQERYSAINWEELAQSDPGRAALMQQQIAVEYAGAKQELENATNRQTQVRSQVMARVAHENNQRFLEAVPEWKDPAVAAKEGQALDQFLVEKVGFNPAELQTVFDARARVVALMAFRWFQHQSSVAQVAGKVRAAPKPVVRPGAGKVTPQAQRQTVSLVQKAKTTQKRADQVAAVTALLNA